MKIGGIDLENQVMVVAEMGNNHEGSYELAAKMISLAAKAGADAVKFQTFRTEHFVSRENEARFNQLKSFELSFAEFEKLSKVATEEGVVFLSTPLDLESAKFLNGLVPAFKIASGDNTFYPLIELVASFAKPIILSTGLLDTRQVADTKKRIEKIWGEKKIKQEIAALHCVCSYPVPPSQANLLAIRELRDQLGCTVGYSDHTTGIDAAVLAVALGARIIEKHFTIDKNHSDFRDHKLSADPAEMELLAKKVKEASALLGAGQKTIQECEKELEQAVRRSIVAARDIAKGATIGPEDITWVRPGVGIPSGNESEVIGKIATRNIRAGEVLNTELFK
ncbi:MAG: N-acetylneuraminate synthase family protein [bacterium]